jgi:SAM-dependent MidA family methyltransferase
MSEQVQQAIVRAIADHGPIPFAEFMEHALYGPGGFYEEPPIGERGHFVTSPHVHPVFGELLARALRGMWTAMGRPVPLRIVELGAGDGTLAQELLQALNDVPIDYTAIERSPGARRTLAGLPVRVASSLEMLGQHLVGSVVIANEVLDNLPFHWIRARDHDFVEIHVGHEGGRFVPIEIPCGGEFLDQAQPLSLGPGEEAAVSLQAFHLLDRLARMLQSGYALLLDYARHDGHLLIRGYRGHREIRDVLAEPGKSDITAGVDFAMISDWLEGFGLETRGPLTQREALHSLGYGEWERKARSNQGTLLRRAHGREAVRTWSERNAARVLVDPLGLGSLMWLAVRTEDVPWPPWLARAALDRRPLEEPD